MSRRKTVSRRASRKAQPRSESKGDGEAIRYDVSGLLADPRVANFPIFSNGGSPRDRQHLSQWPIYSADELGQFPPVEWLIPGWLPARELSCIYGRGDTYKSFIALTWACQLAREDRTVIYIAAEGVTGLRARIAAWMVYNEVPSLPNLLVIKENIALHDVYGQVDEWKGDIRSQVEERNLESPQLIVVDTVARNFVGGDENSAKDMGLFVEGVESIRDEFGAAVVPIHHTKKDARSERGTESLRNASFAMFESKRDKESSRSTVLHCDRMKDAERPSPVTVEFDQVALPILRSDLSSLAMKEPFPPRSGRGDRSDFLEAVLEILDDVPRGAEKITDAFRKKTGSRIGTEKARQLLRRYADDEALPILKADGGGFVRSGDE